MTYPGYAVKTPILSPLSVLAKLRHYATVRRCSSRHADSMIAPFDDNVANPDSHRSPKPSPSDPQREALVGTAELLAKILDTAVRIPGTSIYIGLDPLIGLIPGLGDILANLIGTVIMVLAARLRVPKIVLARMSLNLLINGVVGAIPIAGDLFSIWFRSHARNAELLRRASSQPHRETQQAWLYVAGLIGGTIVLLILAIAAVLWIVVKLWVVFTQYIG